MNIKKEKFGRLSTGQEVDLYILENSNGMEMRVMTYGAIILSLEVPDRDGKAADIVLGYDSLDEYVENNLYFGAAIGRYGNRIGKSKFTLDGVEYTLPVNDGENHLHGGIKGFDKVVWNAEMVQDAKYIGVKFSYLSKDGEEGYPGNLKTVMTYLLTEENELKITYKSQTDKATVVNLTHHSYFNFAGQSNGSILDHELLLNAENFTPISESLIPTGEFRKVKNTPMDFTLSMRIGDRIENDFFQLKYGGGYDHNWVINRKSKGLEFAGRLYEKTSGRVMEVYTTEPGIQFYSGNFLDGTVTGKQNSVYKKRSALCLETQHFPDSVNHPEFPSTVLRPGEKYYTQTIYKFSVKK